MANTEKAELSPKPFKYLKCIPENLTDLKPLFLSMTYRADIEGRYLSGEITSIAGPNRGLNLRQREIPDLQEPLQDVYRELGLNYKKGVLTDERLEEYHTLLRYQLKQIGRNFEEKAEELGILEVMKPEIFALDLDDPNFLRTLEDTYITSYFVSRGWDIYKNIAGGFKMVIPYTNEGTVQNLAIIDLDELYGKDPQFVKEQIKNYHFIQNTEIAIGLITYNTGLHNIYEPSLLPDSLEEITEYTDEDVKGLVKFLTMLGNSNNSLSDNIHLASGNLWSRGVTLTAGRTLTLKDYLYHMESCSDNSQDKKVAYSKLKTYIDSLNGVKVNYDQYDKDRILPKLIGEPLETVNLLKDPTSYTGRILSREELQKRKMLAETLPFINMLNGLDGNETDEQLLKMVEEQTPELFQTLQTFTSWFNKNKNGEYEDRLTPLINKAITSISFQTGRLNFYDCMSIISDLIRYDASYIKEENSSISRQGTQIFFKDDNLHTLLTLRAIKQTISQLKNHPSSVFYSVNTDRFSYAIEQMMQEKQSEIDRAKEELEIIDRKRKLMQQLLSSVNLPSDCFDSFISSLSETGFGNIKTEDEKRFTVLFNAVYFHRKGLINIKSPIFEATIASMFSFIDQSELDYIKQLALI